MNTQEMANSVGGTVSHSDSSEISQPRNETSGGKLRFDYISNEVRRIIEPTLKVLSETTNPNVLKEVKALIYVIVDVILELNESAFDASNLPPLIATNLEDGSFLMEWLFTNYRIGFVIELDPKESIWYLVAKSESADTNLSGSLFDYKKELLISLVSYVAVNS